MKRYDLMQDINCRGTFLLSKAASRTCARPSNPHILTLSPPLNLQPALGGRQPRLHDRQVRDEHVARSGWPRS